MTNFEQLHKKTVQNFLSGVVVIDDNIKFTEAPAVRLETPDDEDELGVGVVETSDNSDATSGSKSEIQAKSVIDPFSKLGIHCVAYEWTDEDTKLPPIALNTDIAIFDWKLGEGNRVTTAKSLIVKLIENSKDCFRYIVIYTSEDLKKITAEIDSLGVANYSSKLNDEAQMVDFTSDSEAHVSIRIQVIEKNDDSELCQKVIDGFATFSSGFLRNATLSGITSIRKNTFKLLSLYSKKLDKAAISHFTSLQSSAEMFDQASLSFHDYISGLLSDNISDVLLYSEDLKASVSQETIISILDEEGPFFCLECNGITKKIKYPSVIQAEDHATFKKNIIENLEIQEGQNLENLKDKVIKNLENGRDAVSIENITEHFKELSHDCCCRNRAIFSSPQKPSHPLKFGTIIFREDAYYMCLQPLCDSIRLSIDKPTTFPFVKLEECKDKSSFDFVLKIKSKFVGFRSVAKPHQSINSFDFTANEATKDVRANEDNIFIDTEEKQSNWVAELKQSYAQELAQTISTSSTRIGMDKFEWLRRK